MSLAPAEKSSPAPAPAGGVHFVAATSHADLCAELRARRYLVAPVVAPERGRLRQAVDEAVEGALALRGALPPAVHLDAALEPTIRDQVFRARALGATGLCVTVPALSASGGLLDLTDSETLLAWLTAAKRAPLLVVLDEADRAARVLSPVAVADLAGPSPLAASDSAPPPSGEVESEARTPPPPVIAMPRRGVMKKRSALRVEVVEAAPKDAAAKVAALMPAVPPLDTTPLPPPPEDEPEPPTTPRPPRVVEAAPPAADTVHRNADTVYRSAEAAPRAEVTPRFAERPRPMGNTRRLAEPALRPVEEAPREVEDEAPVRAIEVTAAMETPPPPAAVMAREAPARRVVDAAESRNHALDLDKARGPKPVAVIERLYTTRYAPLLGAVARGEADQTVRGVVDAWRTSFEHSWREAFSALRVTGKRPPMVFDAPDIAARIGRLNGARAVKLLLVDSMRFDLGERVSERLRDKLTGKAVCVERMLLWSALPTTTPSQLALLGRGADGLRDGEPTSEPEPEITRGRAVSTLRRERVGAREVMKLDLVEARLRNAGPGYDERFDSIADEVTPILIKFIETLAPRTLLFLFGDHGFRLPASLDGRTTGAATQGGPSPEEVLVPGQAWLVGGVH